MIAVLERRFPTDVNPAFESSRLTCGAGTAIEIALPWWLVVRRRVWRSWGDKLRPQLQNGHILLLEDLVDQLGGEGPFNRLVHDLVDGDFYRTWQVGPDSCYLLAGRSTYPLVSR
jgi:hypothetical protein